MRIYFINNLSHKQMEEFIKTDGLTWAGCSRKEDIWIRRDMPKTLIILTVIHEFIHWLDWKMRKKIGLRRIVALYDILEAFWDIYENVSSIIYWRWCRKKYPEFWEYCKR